MFDRTTLTAMLLSALLSVAATCENAAQSLRVLSPQDGQLLRDGDSFFVEIEASDMDFDLSTLEVELNGDALDVVLGDSTHKAILGPGQSLSLLGGQPRPWMIGGVYMAGNESKGGSSKQAAKSCISFRG